MAAIAYEQFDVSLMTDYAYDMSCRLAAESGRCGIPGFNENTGMWAQELPELCTDLTKLVIAKTRDTRDQMVHGPVMRECLDEFGIDYHERYWYGE